MYFLPTYTFKLLFFFRVGGVLIPTRSFGDFLLKSEQDKPPWKQVISAVPQIQTFHLDTQWEFVIVGKLIFPKSYSSCVVLKSEIYIVILLLRCPYDNNLQR